MTHESIRRMLRASGVTMSILRGKREDFDHPVQVLPTLLAQLTPSEVRDWRLTPEEKRLQAGLEPFCNAEDLALWAEIEVRGRLFKTLPSYWSQPSDRFLVLDSLFRGLLAECLLAEFLPEQRLLETLQVQFETLRSRLPTSDAALVHELEADYESHDIRRAVLALSPVIAEKEGVELMRLLGLSFPDRPVRITPEWVRAHQRLDRPNQYWFFHSLHGRGLFLVLFTKRCGYGACTGCSLRTLGCDVLVPSPAIMRQVETCLDRELTQDERASIREVVLSNNGSLFDRRTMPVAALLHACATFVDRLPQVSRLVFETRAEFVSEDILHLVKETLDTSGRKVEMELAIGVEIFDEDLRNRHYRKGLSNEVLRAAITNAAQVSSHLRCYFMYRPLAEMTPSDAAKDIREAAAFLDGIAATSRSEITLHLNPTYVSAGTPLEEAFLRGEYHPVNLDEVEAVVRSLSGHRISLYVGLNDEGLAVPGGSFLRPGSEEVLARLKRFNRTQDFNLLSG